MFTVLINAHVNSVESQNFIHWEQPYQLPVDKGSPILTVPCKTVKGWGEDNYFFNAMSTLK